VQHLEASFSFFSRTVPHHIAPKTVAMLDQESHDVIPPALWPPNSLDLNPVDYTVRSVLQERVYRIKISDVDELKRRINSECAALSHAVIERAVGEWRAFVLEADILSTCCNKDDVM